MNRRRKIVLAVTLLALAGAFITAPMAVHRIAWSRLVTALREAYGVELTSDHFSLALFDGRATARGVQLRDGGELLVGAESVELATSFRSILDGTYSFDELVITRPVAHVVVETKDSTNFARLSKRSTSSGRPAPVVFFRDARVHHGRLQFDDVLTDDDSPVHLSFEGLELALTHLQVSGAALSDEIGDFRLDAVLQQKKSPARMSFVGWAPALREPSTLALHGAITGLDLEPLAPYVERGARLALGGDVLHLGVSMRSERGVILDGAFAAEVVDNGNQHTLRFGGTTSEIVFDEDSRLAALFRLPFARLGHLGDVAMTSTWGVAMDVGGGVVGAGKSVAGGIVQTLHGMIRLDPLGALEAAGGGLVGGAKSLGGGVIGGVQRLFGAGESRARRQQREARERSEFAALHDECRREMLAAALESARDSSPARMRRIVRELAAQKPPPGE